VFHSNPLLITGLMTRLDRDKRCATIVWPDTKAVLSKSLSSAATLLVQGDHVFSIQSSDRLVCLDARTCKQVWETEKVTDFKGRAPIHVTADGDSVWVHTTGLSKPRSNSKTSSRAEQMPLENARSSFSCRSNCD
jgi:hypothetical protein